MIKTTAVILEYFVNLKIFLILQKKSKTPLSEKYIDFDLSLKMFESEIKWFNLHTEKDSVASDSFANTIHKQIEDIINGAKNIDVSTFLEK